VSIGESKRFWAEILAGRLRPGDTLAEKGVVTDVQHEDDPTHGFDKTVRVKSGASIISEFRYHQYVKAFVTHVDDHE